MAGRQLPFNVKVDCSRGAPMGRHDEGPNTVEPIDLRILPFDIDPYDGGGAYWGFGETMWCAFNRDRTTVRYMRAMTRAEITSCIYAAFPAASIHWG